MPAVVHRLSRKGRKEDSPPELPEGAPLGSEWYSSFLDLVAQDKQPFNSSTSVAGVFTLVKGRSKSENYLQRSFWPWPFKIGLPRSIPGSQPGWHGSLSIHSINRTDGHIFHIYTIN